MTNLDRIREEITQTDKKIVELIAYRVELTEKVISAKLSLGRSLIDYDREDIVLENIENYALTSGLDPIMMRKIYSDIIFLSRNNQVKEYAMAHPRGDEITLGFQGELGAYSHLAIMKHYKEIKVVPKRDFREAFDALELNEVDAVLVPVENSIEGTVRPVYDLLLDRDVVAVQEVVLKVEHMLIGHKGKQINEVYSHPQALAQCRNYLSRQKFEQIPASDTAGSVKMIKEKNIQNAAAIASKQAAEIYGLDIIEENIEDNPDNFTRFFLVTRVDKLQKISRIVEADPSKKYKTSVIFGVNDRSGSLLDVLELVAKYNVNMTKLESRPSRKKPWDYTFYVDFEGHQEDKSVYKMFAEIKQKTTFFQVIGSYATVY